MSYEMAQRSGPRISIFSSGSSSSGTPSSSWLPSWRGRDQYSSLPSNASEAYAPSRPSAGTSRRRLLQGATAVVGGLFLLAVMTRGGSDHTVVDDASNGDDRVDGASGMERPASGMERPANWGLSEALGWTSEGVPDLADLGNIAEERYRLSFDASDEGVKTYYRQLQDFSSALTPTLSIPLLYSIYTHLPPALSDFLPEPMKPKLGPPSMISYKTIHQTDKSKETLNDMTKQWVETNERDGWRLNFLDDEDGWDWVRRTFPGSDVEWAWGYMHRGVLRADFLRYLLPLVEGGVYSDVDTRPIRPIEQWGQVDVETLDLSDTDGPGWRRALATHPAVIVAIDVNVHSFMDWWQQWPRAVGICQWTLSGAPHHPIYIDAARRVVNATRVVEAWDQEQLAKIEKLEAERPPGWEVQVAEIKGQKKDHAMNVMEWTGPGLFSDAVMAFLLARYKVTWHRLRGLDHPLRIGDVLILPITAFSPGGMPDFKSGPPDSPQADVLHNFRGSWKGEGA